MLLFEENKADKWIFWESVKNIWCYEQCHQKVCFFWISEREQKPIADYISIWNPTKNLVSENKFFDAIDTYNKTIGDSKGFID